MRHSKSSVLMSALAGGLIAGLTTLSLQVIAEPEPELDTVPRQIPYNGTLEFNGETVTRTGAEAPWIRFDLIDYSAPNWAPDWEPGAPAYSQTMQVNVYNGKFTAMLGPIGDNGVDLFQTIALSEDYRISLTMLGEHNPDNPEASAADDITLSNPQKLLMTPFAMTAAGAVNFDVTHQLQVQGATVSNHIYSDRGVNSSRLTLYRSVDLISDFGQPTTGFSQDFVSFEWVGDTPRLSVPNILPPNNGAGTLLPGPFDIKAKIVVDAIETHRTQLKPSSWRPTIDHTGATAACDQDSQLGMMFMDYPEASNGNTSSMCVCSKTNGVFGWRVMPMAAPGGQGWQDTIHPNACAN